MKAFVLAENESAARELCAGARSMADEVVLVSVGVAPVEGVADTCVHLEVPAEAIVDDAYVSVNGLYDEQNPEIVLVEPTRRMKSLAGRLAAHAKTSVITDVISFNGKEATNMYFGGVGERTYAPNGLALYTVGAGIFDAAQASGTNEVTELAWTAPERGAVKTGVKDLPVSDVNLQAADVIVACGRGFAEQADLDPARELAGKLNGEMGCSRPLAEGVDWFPREAYIGVSGVVAAPKVYVGIGISGQMQHMVGVSRAQTIIAINKDKNAPIFKQCDFGIVGDLKDILPALNAAL